ncbi:hypothetical protein GCM10009425_00910 [Pseudomonas asuensis]|uniref:Uncharacterized protein n=1 Tax=Pseudomonas asuensis TaxID=1825787 RepID=A0ABQ2GGP8_9PSED|nr:hypothetical protein GCM10009425_00910 [Pseudomonas asuensis]
MLTPGHNSVCMRDTLLWRVISFYVTDTYAGLFMPIQLRSKVLSEAAVTGMTITDYWRQGVCSVRMIDIK